MPDKLPWPGMPKHCAMCNQKHVPEVILSTTELPTDVTNCKWTQHSRIKAPIIGIGKFLEAKVCRLKKKGDVLQCCSVDNNIFKGEFNAMQLNTALPFLEYDLHRQVMLKLRMMVSNFFFIV